MATKILNIIVFLALAGNIAAETQHDNQLSLSTLKERALEFFHLSGGKIEIEEAADIDLVDGTTPKTNTITKRKNASTANVD